MFLRRKRLIQKLQCNKEVIFLYLEANSADLEASHEKSEIF
jgi:hypothetical protein